MFEQILDFADDIEWVDSGDREPGYEDQAMRECLN